ncbi:MAG: histidine kinase [Bacteroidetes bacterium]|nr:histidine kinase [Bacteroidota bacterium]MBT3749274.1 histidine kinase [Bacteroidota bacterium]MBT4397914.1 histidine kinase [Bacteroidota bacterium]MBT4410512.1 histidine kinase [Bacteroidota bacterium]MBT7464301.1 histidine kinase [Bacteroidota bacterium]
MRLRFKQIRVLLFHALFWTAVWFFFVYFFSYNSVDTAYAIWFSSCLLPLTIMLTYYVVYKLIPGFLLTRKYLKFFLYSFYTLVFSSYFIVLAIYACLIFLLDFNIAIMPPMSKNFLFILILVYLIVVLVSFVSVLNHNFKTDSRNKELQNKILATQLQIKEQELHYLKRQIHPHFLFNTLNTIYGFALKQSKHTPDIILKLSNLLDYILYQINKPKVNLKEEVMHIKEYVELEKIRFQDTLKVTFDTNEIDDDIQVPPMLLIPFVENAFKHGDIKDGFLQLEIEIEARNNLLDFKIRNTILQTDDNNELQGIGLENIRKRLDLHYKEKYKLEIKTDEHWFSVKLRILNLNAISNV